MPSLEICYWCRKPIVPSDKATVDVAYYGGIAHGESQKVPVHKACKRGKKIIQGLERAFWER